MPLPNSQQDSSSTADRRRRGREALLWGTLVLVMLALVGLSIQRGGFQRSPPPPIFAQLPVFELIDQRGQAFGTRELAGVPWVADFVFTRCPGICPRMTELMRGLKARLPAGTRTVSITVDPGHDTPSILADYGRRFATSEDWTFLTGDRLAIYQLCRDGFKMPVEALTEDAGDAIEPILHSNRFVLVDGAGQIRGYYDSFDNTELERLLDDHRALLRQH